MMVTPFQTPTLVKRRLTPPKAASAALIAVGGIPRCRATAIAASAFETLWSPVIGSVTPSIARPSAFSATSNRAPPSS